MSDPRFKDPLYISGYSDGIANEQSRIIKLLETEIANTPNTLFSEVLSGAIALIKGENK